jgi:hypothetical protein
VIQGHRCNSVIKGHCKNVVKDVKETDRHGQAYNVFFVYAKG